MADNDEDFAAMFAESERDTSRAKKRPRVGDPVTGKVVTIGKEAVFVDVGGKAEGMIDRVEVSDPEGNLLVKVGDSIDARVVADSGVLTLRVKVARGPEARAELQQAHQLGVPVEGVVTEVIKGGVSVDVAGVRGFCPASQIDVRFVDDLATYVGQRLTFRITRYEPRNLVLSRRALLEEDNARRAAETRKKIEPGAVLRGKVVGFKPFGAFVDLGGIEGMLHVSELGYARVERPEDVLSLGQEVEVAVLKIEPGDRPSHRADRSGSGDRPERSGERHERISLSLKALATDPWRDTAATLGEGTRVRGKITRLQPFGAFVEIAPGVEGLVHISELGGDRRIHHPKDVVSVGQEVEATVLSVDHERRRIGLSIAASREGTADDVAEADKAAQAVKSSVPTKLGTFADLLKKR